MLLSHDLNLERKKYIFIFLEKGFYFNLHIKWKQQIRMRHTHFPKSNLLLLKLWYMNNPNTQLWYPTYIPYIINTNTITYLHSMHTHFFSTSNKLHTLIQYIYLRVAVLIQSRLTFVKVVICLSYSNCVFSNNFIFFVL